jgi:hypothetical protein
MATENKTTALRPPKAPNLPIAPTQYDQRYIDTFTNTLRLYFNQIDNFTQPFTQQNGGAYLQFPYIAAYHYPAQYATADNTPTITTWSAQAGGSGFTLNANNTATAEFSGNYKITYSLQFANDDNVTHDAIVWLRVNGVDVADSTTVFTVSARKSAGVPTYVAAYSEVVFPLNAGDNVGLWWGTEHAATSGGATGVLMYARAAQTSPMPYPETPSAIGSITFVSALY